MKPTPSLVHLVCVLGSSVPLLCSVNLRAQPVTNCDSPPSGLVAWWEAENNALDSVGTNTGTLQPGVSFVPGEVANAFYFNGNTNSYIEVPDSPALDLTNELTIEFWVKRLRLTYPSYPYADYIVEKGGDWTGGAQNYGVALHNPTYNYCLHFTFANGWRGAGSIADTNLWHHCAVVARNGDPNPTFYIDGVQQPVTYSEGASNINLYNSNRPLHIGAQLDPVTGWYYFGDTLVDEISLYNRALSAAEIQGIYNAGSAGKCTTPQPVYIISQPQNLATSAGGPAAFSVAASGSPPLSYQWFFGSNPIAGATLSTLTLYNIQPNQAGFYSVVVSNSVGSLLSSNAMLTVLTFPPSIVTQPAGANIYVGSNAFIFVNAAGSPPLAYQWLKDSVPVPGATAPAISFFHATTTNSGGYSVIITSPYGAVTSAVATLNVVPPPPCAPAPTGMVAWWRGEGNLLDSYDSQNATVSNLIRYVPGKVGTALNFSGIASAAVPDSPALRFTNAMTIECWVNPTDVSTPRTILAKFDRNRPFIPPLPPVGGTNGSYYLGTTNSGHISFSISRNGMAVTNLVSATPIPANAWSFVVATYDGASLQLYINAVPVAQRDYSAGIFPGTDDLGLGILLGDGTAGIPSAWSGSLDEITLYNRALSLDEIQAIYTADISGKCLLPPTITLQPQSQSIPRGEDVLFAPTVVGAKPLYYQWRFNGTNLPGRTIPIVTNATLLLEKVQSNRIGNYSVLITNSVGAILSSNAMLSLLPPPSCDPAPTNLVSWWPAEGTPIDVVGTNNPYPSFDITYPTGKVGHAFGFNGVNSRLTVLSSPSLNFGTNADFSIEAWIKVLPPIIILQNNYDNMSIVEKRSFTQPFLPDGGYALSLYRGRLAFWLGRTIFIPRATTTNMFISDGPDLRDGMFHHVAASIDRHHTNSCNLYVDGQPVLNFNAAVPFTVVSNSAPLYIGATAAYAVNAYFSGLIDELSLYNRALSAAEILAIRQAGAAGKCEMPPIITAQPTNTAVPRGGSATFTVGAVGFPTLNYQWRFGSQTLFGATKSSLTISNVQSINTGLYSVRITNAAGSVTSTNALLSINLPPVANCTNVVVAADSNCVAYASVNNGSYDRDGDPISLFQTPPGPYPLGVTAVTLTAVDIWGASNSCVATVQVVDQTPPTISAPASIMATNDLNQCGAIVNFTFPTAVDNCGPANVGCSPLPGSFFPVGITPVHVTATDAANNVTNYYFNVTVRDVQPPTITCPDNISVTNAHNAWTSVVTFNPTASDNCPGVGSPVCSPASGSAFPIGVNTVNCSVIDAGGNSTHCSFTVTVHPGNVPPVPIIEVSPLSQFPGDTNLIVIAPNNTNVTVVFDGSRSYDVDDTNFLYYWYEGTNLFSTNVVAHDTLAVGSHDITLWLDDTFPLGTNATSVTVEVITPAEAVGIVIAMVENANFGNRNSQPLLASLNAAAASFDRGNITPALNQLAAFQHKVQAQVAPSQPALATQLITAAQVIIDAMTRPMPIYVTRPVAPAIQLGPALSAPLPGP